MTINKKKGLKIFICCLLMLPMELYSQSSKIKGQIIEKASELLNPKRIQEAHYKLVMYQQDNDVISDISILDRQVKKEVYNSELCFKIMERSTSNVEIEAFIDANTLLPRYLKKNNNDTLTTEYIFKKEKIIEYQIKDGVKEERELKSSEGTYLSNSFSEIIQAHNFAGNRKLEFRTINPGRRVNHFIVERIADKKFLHSDNTIVDCWILRFTILDSNGKQIPAGFRYVDKITGEVVLFKSENDSDVYFTYQKLFLE